MFYLLAKYKGLYHSWDYDKYDWLYDRRIMA